MSPRDFCCFCYFIFVFCLPTDFRLLISQRIRKSSLLECPISFCLFQLLSKYNFFFVLQYYNLALTDHDFFDILNT